MTHMLRRLEPICHILYMWGTPQFSINGDINRSSSPLIISLDSSSYVTCLYATSSPFSSPMPQVWASSHQQPELWTSEVHIAKQDVANLQGGLEGCSPSPEQDSQGGKQGKKPLTKSASTNNMSVLGFMGWKVMELSPTWFGLNAARGWKCNP